MTAALLHNLSRHHKHHNDRGRGSDRPSPKPLSLEIWCRARVGRSSFAQLHAALSIDVSGIVDNLWLLETLHDLRNGIFQHLSV